MYHTSMAGQGLGRIRSCKMFFMNRTALCMGVNAQVWVKGLGFDYQHGP